MMLQASGVDAPGAVALGWTGLLHNLVPVIAGNLVGGSVLVGLIYHVIYRRGARAA
jgi:formate/nitrite transporter FocA (FNT family)